MRHLVHGFSPHPTAVYPNGGVPKQGA